MIVWSYSLFGSNKEVYYNPMLENIRIAKENNVKIIISTTDLYVDEVKQYFASYLENLHIEVYPSHTYAGSETVLRFLSVDVIEADFYFIKDSDSIVTERELYIMNHWMLLVNDDFMIIRDNPVHVSLIMAGMFGFKNCVRNELLKSCRDIFTLGKQKLNYGYDQRWLAEKIYPIIRKNTQVYSSFFYFQKEKLCRIARVSPQVNFIGAPSFGNTNPNSLEKYFMPLYDNRLLNLPYFSTLPSFLSRLIYGRVRPTIYIAFFLRWLKISK